jgi:hypothetical protein
VALTGVQVGPGLFDVVELLGKTRVVERLDRAATFVDNMHSRMPESGISDH